MIENVGKRKMGKRGASTVTIIRAAGIAVAAIAIWMMLTYWRDVKDDTFLEKNYIARDLAGLITTVYASPGAITYCYSLVGNYNGKFDYSIGNSRVVVADHGRPFIESNAVYKYVEGKDNPLSGLEIIESEAKELAALLLIKEGNIVKVVPKKRGELVEPCTE